MKKICLAVLPALTIVLELLPLVLSIITVVISLLPLMYGLDYYTLVGAFITGTLVIESVLAKIQQK